MSLLPRRYVRPYLESAPSLVWLIVANVVTVLVGVDFYVAGMTTMFPLLWPVYADSPVATFLMVLSLTTLLSNLGRRLEAAPQNLVLAYLHTFAFVWLLKYGLWPAVALNLGFGAYFPEVWSYWGIVLTHLAFVLEALAIPHYGRTTRGALASALLVSLLGDLLDYGFGFHPPLRYDPGIALPLSTVALTFVAVWLASREFDRLEGA